MGTQEKEILSETLWSDKGGERLPSPLRLEYHRAVDGKADLWEPLTSFPYHDPVTEKTVTARARRPDGGAWLSDLGSIPVFLRSFLGVADWAEAFIIHDWSCDFLVWDNGEAMTQRTADRLLRDIALYTGHSRWIVYPAWSLVRAYSMTVKKWKRAA